MQHLDHRRDIDGLRAVAVLSVVFFHATPHKPVGGFVGVDIFFVISGFLITSIIMKNMEQGKFSFAEFYGRRIRRLFPALAIVMTACLAAGWVMLFPDEYWMLGKHALAGSSFVSNLVFWSEANYFDVTASAKPFLHLWSLGIEEQYYLFCPAILWLAIRLRLNLITLTLAGLLLSFLVCTDLVRYNATAAFYSPLTRSWELFMGGLLALMTLQAGSDPKRDVGERIAAALTPILFSSSGPRIRVEQLRTFASILGFILVAYAIMDVRADRFPSWSALTPTLGATLLIAAGPTTWINRNLLGNRVMVWFGLISYPLYLWHWPLLSFAYIRDQQSPPLPLALAIVALSVLLAWLTYLIVERPIRTTGRPAAVTGGLLAAMVAVGVFGAVNFANGGFSWRLKDRQQFADYFDALAYDGSKFVEEREQISQNKCNFYNYKSSLPTLVPRPEIAPECYIKTGTKSVMLWGDSHAAHYLHGLQQTLPADITPLLVFGSGCRARYPNEANANQERCDKANSFALKVARERTPDIVIMAATTPLEVEFARSMTATLKSYGVKHVIVMGLVPHYRAFLYKIILRRYWPEIPRRTTGFLDPRHVKFDQDFRASLSANEPFEFVHTFDTFCNNEGCLAYVGDDVYEGLVVFDHQHLRPRASIYFAQTTLTPLILRLLAQDRTAQTTGDTAAAMK
ncbi:putative Acyltransferase, group 3; O-antigen acetylase [Bradyrhizobium sp. ORS 375]|uniref:acyltransferase family protein n=1 Tax=Bradyrhizobium sp. (strain ORS 375) TaxID=566679 RepID=UPI0002408B17|nr:acyltransferase family protein [Bradyrhizobium sp. ORS 375]CCD92689.1 putative Acyltransferase, group 3; O-antigen acetylase [Bradyrhizobium sp. ORS 375]